MKHLQKSFIIIFSMVSLVGAGCLPSAGPKPEPAPETVTTPMPKRPTLPTEEEVDNMTEEERDKAMKDFLAVNGPMAIEPEKIQAAGDIAKEMKAMPAERSGSFKKVVHEASGSARLVQKDGKWIVVFSDDFTTDAGPQLHVYVSGNADPRTSPQVHEDPSADLGRLVKTVGGQAYEIPSGIDAEKIKSIVVYCKPFKVVFAVASL